MSWFDELNDKQRGEVLLFTMGYLKGATSDYKANDYARSENARFAGRILGAMEREANEKLAGKKPQVNMK